MAYSNPDGASADHDRPARKLTTSPGPPGAAEAEALTEQVNYHVRAVLLELPALLRLPIVLAFFGGYTYRQVAVRLGEPEGIVKARIRAGLLRLRAGAETLAISAD